MNLGVVDGEPRSPHGGIGVTSKIHWRPLRHRMRPGFDLLGRPITTWRIMQNQPPLQSLQRFCALTYLVNDVQVLNCFNYDAQPYDDAVSKCIRDDALSQYLLEEEGSHRIAWGDPFFSTW